MIDETKLTDEDIGRWVLYEEFVGKKKKGRIKSWTFGCIYVVYKCDGEWDRFQDFTAFATPPSRATFIKDEMRAVRTRK